MAGLDPHSYFGALKLSFGAQSSAAAALEPIQKAYEQQLWHEFSTGILDLAQRDANIRSASHDIHDVLLVPVRSNIDGSVYVKLVFFALHSLADAPAADAQETESKVVTLLDSAIASLMTNGHHQCVSAMWALKALWHMAHGPSLEAKALLQKANDAIGAVPVHDILPISQALYFRAHVRQSELLCEYDDFYASSFAYLRYGELAGLPDTGDLGPVAYKTAIAALLARKVYNFGELLTTPAYIHALEQTKPWALEVIQTCGRGDVAGYERFVKAHADTIQSIPELHDAVASGRLGTKVRLMSLLHLIFHTPADKRVISFSTIAERCAINLVEVEPLLLTALAQSLIEGSIDELDQTVEVTWVLPRVMNTAEIAALAENIANWRKTVKSVADHVGKLASNITK